MRIICAQTVGFLFATLFFCGVAAAHPASDPAGVHTMVMQNESVSPFHSPQGKHCPMHGNHDGRPCPHQKMSGQKSAPLECQLRVDCPRSTHSNLPHTSNSPSHGKILMGVSHIPDDSGVCVPLALASVNFIPHDTEQVDPPPRHI